MAKKDQKKVLGRGLSALLDNPQKEILTIKDKNADKVVGNIIDIDLSKIKLNPFQPRTNFNQDAINDLAKSIEALGVIQPITVRKLEINKYQLVSGERRFRAVESLGERTIPAYVRIANDQEMLEMALVENIQRRDLDPIEIALSYRRLIDEIKLTQEKLSIRVGKKRSTVANYLRLLKLDPIIQTGMRDGFLSMGHGRALINIDNHNKQLQIYEIIIKNGLSVRDTEIIVNKFKSSKERVKKIVYPAEEFSLAEKKLKNYFNLKVSIKANSNGKGKIEIFFDSNKNLNDLIKKITSED